MVNPEPVLIVVIHDQGDAVRHPTHGHSRFSAILIHVTPVRVIERREVGSSKLESADEIQQNFQLLSVFALLHLLQTLDDLSSSAVSPEGAKLQKRVHRVVL